MFGFGPCFRMQNREAYFVLRHFLKYFLVAFISVAGDLLILTEKIEIIEPNPRFLVKLLSASKIIDMAQVKTVDTRPSRDLWSDNDLLA